MKLRNFLIFALICVAVTGSGFASAEPYLKNDHYSIAALTDGHSDINTARFFYIRSMVESGDTTATKDFVNLKGVITFEDGSYSFIEKSLVKTLTGAKKSFDLVSNMSLNDDSVNYKPIDSADNPIRFISESETGLTGTNVSWTFASMPSLNGQQTIGDFKTTQEQLDDFVPYVEIVSADGKATGVNWRLVKSSDVSKAVSRDYEIKVRVAAWDGYGTDYYGSRVTKSSGQTLAGTETFNNPISDLFCVEVTLYLPDYLPGRNIWRFYNFQEEKASLWVNHVNNASLVDGKSNYTDASLEFVYLSTMDNDRIAEAKYFTDTGTIKIPAGTYTLKSDVTGNTLNTVTLNNDTDFNLRMHYEVDLGDDWIEYQPVSDDGTPLAFAGNGVENLISGKSISWTFPDELKLNMSGKADAPKLKTTQEQLETGVPYVEVVSSDGKITAIKYKIVTSSDLSTAITPSYQTDFRLYVRHNNGGTYQSDWIKNSSQGTWNLDESQNLSDINRITVRLRSHEDEENPFVCQWNFSPASANNQDTGDKTDNKTEEETSTSGSSGGCELGFGIFGLAVLGIALLHKRSR